MNTQKPLENFAASSLWAAILTQIEIPNRMTWTLLQPSKAVSFDGSTLTVEASKDAVDFVNNPKMLEHLSRVAGCMGYSGLKFAFQLAPVAVPAPPTTPPSPSYYLVTDACTGEHLGFPSISLIEAHLKLASIGPEWPAVALLAHRYGDQSGKCMLWQAGERGARKGHPVKLLHVGKE